MSDERCRAADALRIAPSPPNRDPGCGRHRIPPEIVAHAVRLCSRFGLGLRAVGEMPLERGVEVSRGTLRRWVIGSGPDDLARPKPPRLSAR